MQSNPYSLAQYSIGDAIKKMLNDSNWKSRYHQSLVKENWEDIMGAVVAKYTDEVQLVGNKLYIRTQVAPLKHELLMNKDNIITKVNEYLKETVVREVIIG